MYTEKEGRVIAPEGIKKIASFAFVYCEKLMYIEFSLGLEAFV